jgi:hypothetical protein
MSFNWACWIYAFSYWQLSLMLNLKVNNWEPDHYGKKPMVVFVFFTVLVWALPVFPFIVTNNTKVFIFLIEIQNISLIISCGFLIDALARLIKLMKFLDDTSLVDR